MLSLESINGFFSLHDFPASRRRTVPCMAQGFYFVFLFFDEAFVELFPKTGSSSKIFSSLPYFYFCPLASLSDLSA